MDKILKVLFTVAVFLVLFLYAIVPVGLSRAEHISDMPHAYKVDNWTGKVTYIRRSHEYDVVYRDKPFKPAIILP